MKNFSISDIECRSLIKELRHGADTDVSDSTLQHCANVIEYLLKDRNKTQRLLEESYNDLVGHRG